MVDRVRFDYNNPPPPLHLGKPIEKFNLNHATAQREIKRIGKFSGASKRVTQDLSPVNRQHVDCCPSLLTELLQITFLDKLVTDDEKRMLYHNVKRRLQWIGRGNTPGQLPRGVLHSY